MSKCPHGDVFYCPLYHASHMAAGGCDDGKLESGTCAVKRGMNYRAALERLRVEHPGVVERLAFLEEANEARIQRARNLRLAGIH